MLRLLSIRDFVLVDALDLELAPGFSVLTGETGAGKSILLDALALLMGDRFELRQLRAGAERAELAAAFDLDELPTVRAWLAEQALADDGGELLVRRVLDAQGRSRAWINGRPATLSQLKELAERLVDLHGQHAHQTLSTPDEQRRLVDAFGGFSALSREVADAWRAWRAAAERHAAAASAAQAGAAEREFLEARQKELAALAVGENEWAELSTVQSRLANAASLIEVSTQGEDALAAGDDALTVQLAQLVSRLRAEAAHDPALDEAIGLIEPARIQLEEAARALRDYRRRLDLDPAELARVEERLSALHDAARRHRTRPDGLPALLAETEARIAALAESTDADALGRRAAEAEARFRALAGDLTHKRRYAASELGNRVTAAMQELAMPGGRLEIALVPLASPASHGLETLEFRVATHPKQPLAALSKVASGGELSRIALAIRVVTSEVGDVPTLVFDEVDTGIGGAVAATVGRLMQAIGARRQVLCVTHLPQVAAFADHHYTVVKRGDADAITSDVTPLGRDARVDEIARMLAAGDVTAKTRAHARELLTRNRRSAPSET